MDDDRLPEPTTRLLEEFVRHVSERVTVPPPPVAQPSRRRGRWSPAPRRGLAIALATIAVVGATGLIVAYGPRSSPIVARPLPTSQSTLGSSATIPVAVENCTVRQLTATVDFNQTETDPGAIRLTNTAGRACSLSGQPQVMILDGSGAALDINQSVFHQAPDWPPPSSPIVLSAAAAPPQAIVQLDWTWGGAPPGKVWFQIRFEGWPSSLTVANSAVSPPGYAPPPCTNSGAHSLLAVDYVRGYGLDGIIGPGPSEPSTTPAFGADAIGDVPMNTAETRAVAAIGRRRARSNHR